MNKIYFLCLLLLSALATSSSAQSGTIHVNRAATGTNTGENWLNAFVDLQDALNVATAGDEIWVAAGTYFPTTGSDRLATFKVPNGVRLLGGFTGAETAAAQRDWAANPVVLSGDIGQPSDSTDNAYNVMLLEYPDTNTVVDGFTLCFGNADYAEGDVPLRDRSKCGGGLYILGEDGEAYPDIKNCRFERNYARNYGGGVFVNGTSGGSVAPRFLDCRFERNHAGRFGGGACRFGGSYLERSPDWGGCGFAENHSDGSGGGLYISDGRGTDTLDIHKCSFEHNSLMNVGAALVFYGGRVVGGSEIYLKRCDFVANNAKTHGGSIIFIDTNFNGLFRKTTIDSTNFIDNISASSNALISIVIGDIAASMSPFVAITNSSVIDNQSSQRLIVVESISPGGNSIFSNNIFYTNKGLPFKFSRMATLEISKVFCYSNIYETIFDLGRCYSTKLTDCVFKKQNNGVIKLTESDIVVKNSIFESDTLGVSIFNSALMPINSVFKARKQGDNKLIYHVYDTDFRAGFVNSYVSPPISGKPISPSNDIQISFTHCYLPNTDCTTLPTYITCGPGNIFSGDPMFVDTAAGDYRLLPCSPLVNAGTNAAVSPGDTDLDGRPRILGGTVDIGPYEMPGIALAAAPDVRGSCAGGT
ncbi:MAG: choice-of-anchor Q domain-containing protein, partial [Saprospiraceae bacterium]